MYLSFPISRLGSPGSTLRGCLLQDGFYGCPCGPYLWKGRKGSRIGHREIPGYKAGLGSTDLSGTLGPKWPVTLDLY